MPLTFVSEEGQEERDEWSAKKQARLGEKRAEAQAQAEAERVLVGRQGGGYKKEIPEI